MNELARYELVDAEGLVVNTILWDGVTPLDIPVGHSLRLAEG